MKSTNKYYTTNKKYSDFLESQEEIVFTKYADFIKKYVGSGGRALDVGCGTGISLELLNDREVDAAGIDISKTSIEICKGKGLDCRYYAGDVIPYDEKFDVVGSYNVLEHTEDCVEFLQESLRVTKDGGYLIVACPNFLSITNSYHAHTRGIVRKVSNLLKTIIKIFAPSKKFEKMEMTIREDFQPDDDACNVTNPLDILYWSKRNNLKLVYWSSCSVYKNGLISKLDFGFFRLFLGSSFMVFKK